MTNENYIKEAEAAYDEALEIVKNNDGWKLEKEDKANQVTVEMKKNSKGRKIYRCKVSQGAKGTAKMSYDYVLSLGQDQHPCQVTDAVHL